MTFILRVLLGLGPVAVVGAPVALEFQKLFTRPGVVGEGWVVRDWTDVSKPPKWPVVWEVDADGILYGTGRYSPGTTGDRWIGTWLLSEREYGDFLLELEFKFRNDGKSGNGGIALRAPLAGDPAYEGLELQITDPRYEYSYFPARPPSSSRELSTSSPERRSSPISRASGTGTASSCADLWSRSGSTGSSSRTSTWIG
jgi:hypothetical protein